MSTTTRRAHRASEVGWSSFRISVRGRSTTTAEFPAPTREYPISVWSVALSADRRLPADLVPAGAWPDELPADAGPDVQLAAGIAIRLKKRVDGLTLRKAQQRTGISRSTINKIINGRTWPTIANLEAGLKMRLWGKEHRRWK